MGLASVRALQLVTISVAALASALPVSAAAQSTADLEQAAPSAGTALPEGVQDSTSASPTVGDIVVTGSRLVRNGANAPTPVTVIGEEQIQKQAPSLLIDLARTLPQFKNTTAAANGGTNTVSGGQSALNLRGLGTNRNLVLLDGRRIVPSSPNGVVNIDVLPSALVSRLDIVTGGASATYGSDAVSGVVNFILDTGLEGLKGSLQTGVSSRGDNGSRQVSLAAGTSFADGRGHIVASAEYFDIDGIGPLSRDYQRRRTGVISNVDYTPTNGQPQRIVTDGIVFASMTTGGIINSGLNANGTANNLLRGIAFGPNGQPYQFRYGSNYTTTSTTMIAPAGASLTNGEYTDIADGTYVSLPNSRTALFAHGKYEVSDNLKLFAEGLYADVKTGPFNTAAPYRFGTSAATSIQIRADNPYLPANIAAQMSGVGGANPAGPAIINVGRNSVDWGGYEEVHLRNRTARGVVGARGGLGGGWKWDIYYQYGQNHYTQFLPRNLIVGNLALASDAVRAPAGNAAGIAAGTIVCRSKLTNPSNGCVPINIFGYGSASPQAIDYVLGEQRSELRYVQHVVEGNIRGNLLTLPAGPVGVAFGAGYRAEHVDQTSDALSQQRAFVLGNPQPFSGRYNIKDAFGEISVPIFRNQPLAQEVSVDAAARYTDYSVGGGVTTWKVGLVYVITDGVRLRATRSRDIRAASLNELFLGAQQFVGSALDPVTNTIARPQSITSGSADLTPEKADTFTAGVVFQPLSNLTLSADYYNIAVKDVISQLGDQQIVDRCAGGQQELCALITRTNGVITQIRRPFLNLASLKISGLDIEASYRFDLQAAGLSIPGALGLRVLATYVDRFDTSDGVTTLSAAGSVGDGQPRWSGRADIVYENGGFSAGVIARYVGSGVYGNQFKVPNAINFNNVGDRAYVSLNAQQRITMGSRYAEFYGVVDNLFDVDPPIGFSTSNGFNPAPTYDTLGTMFRVGLRFRL